MPDLNTALTRHLAENTPGAVAPFADVKRRARRRTVTRAAVGALAAVVLLAGVATLAVWRLDQRPQPAPATVDGPPPELITVDGRELRLQGEAELGSVWIETADRSTLVVEAGRIAPDAGGPCEPFTVARILSQDGQSVSIGAYDYKAVVMPTGSIGCPEPAYPAKRHRLDLGQPLNGRTVLRDGQPVRVIDVATLLTPAYVPAGYSPIGERTLGDWPRRDRDLAGYAQWTHTGPNGDFFYIRQADPQAERALNAKPGQASLFGPEEAFEVVSRPAVRGHDGLVFDYGPILRCVRWREAVDTAVVICSHAMPEAPLAQEELLKIAESLRRAS